MKICEKNKHKDMNDLLKLKKTIHTIRDLYVNIQNVLILIGSLVVKSMMRMNTKQKLHVVKSQGDRTYIG